MPSTSNVNLSGNLDIDGVLSGVKWADTNITFSFPTSLSYYGYSVTGFEAMNAAQMAAERSVLAQYQAVSGLRFTEVTETSTTHGTLRFAEENNAGTAYTYYPSSAIQGGDAWFNHNDYNSAAKGSYAYATFLHETGHALGLDHGQDGLKALTTDHDSLEYSVMTYRSFVGADLNGYTVKQGSYPTTLMLDDIAAIQYMYGANYSTNNTNTTYTWNPNTGEMSINGAAQGNATGTNKIFMTLWDGGGVDTYDFSNYSTNLTVDLSPGSWTTTSTAQLADLGGSFYPNHFARGNIANAYLYQGNTASLIENANGGSGNDVITGNQANNVITGNGGNDTLNGGDGNDTLSGGAGNDTISGGNGTDTCVINSVLALCTVTYDSSTTTYTISSLLTGTDRVTGVEYFQFTDGTRAVSALGGLPLPPIDLSAPTLTATSPADNATAVATTANLTLTFSENAVAGTGSIVIRTAAGAVVATIAAADATQVSFAGGVVTINPTANLAASQSYYVTIDGTAFKDTAGNLYAGISSSTAFNFTTAAAPADTVAPTLVSTSPADNSGSVTASSNLVLNFSENVAAGTGNIVVHAAGGAVVTTIHASDTSQVAISGSVVTINPGADLNPGSGYYVTVDGTAFHDLAGNNYAGIASADAFNFTTAASIINGTSAANTLNGTAYADTINGLGGNDTLNGNDGNDYLDGGTGNDKMAGGNGDDTYVVDSKSDIVTENANAGNDTVNSSVTWTLGNNIENLLLTGSSAISGTGNSLANAIAGNGAANTLNGGAGNDTLYGRGGSDTLTGGAGQDYFAFDTALGSGNIDKITDFSVADDTIALSLSIFTQLGATGTLNSAAFVIGSAAKDASDHIIYNSSTGALYYDADGAGGAAQQQIATLTKSLAMTASDFLIIA